MMHERVREFSVLTLLCLTVPVILTACVSRYHLDLYLTSQGFTEKMKIEETRLLMDHGLADPYAREKVQPDSTTVLMIQTGVRWDHVEEKRRFMLGFDEYLQLRFYMVLPPLPSVDTIPVADRSLVHVLGRYDLPAESNIFLPDTGRFVIDSVRSDSYFCTINALYRNRADVPLELNGEFRIKRDRLGFAAASVKAL